ncbi:hypothetical protein AYO20_05977 [Fonsecaea nubica]|uniref:Transcription factor domain-containing protein n=1 Tax=Fonsecaea nubica TaxID=856822 RepID=A0A178CZX4_9EURO|nr:hypothetical protein AYO20_05977 [Fonsecaea nubica]OAL34782.1 hypothetical protein AYO20_05977 [Fonsecaea nubica]
MQSNKRSGFAPEILWFGTKTPTNFRSTPDYEQKTIIAVRAQQYSIEKRVEQASSLLESPESASQSPRGRNSSSSSYERANKINPGLRVIKELQVIRQEPPGSRRKIPSEANQAEDIHDQDDDQGLLYAKATKRRLRPQHRTRLTRASGILSARKVSSLSVLLQGGNSDPFSATPIPLSALRHSVITTIQPVSLKTIWADEVATPNAARFLVPAQNRVYKSYMSHEAVMHALLAYCWSAIARLQPHKKALYHDYALEHETRSIHALQPLVVSDSHADDNLEVAVQTVLLLCSAAMYRSRLDALFLHLNGLKQMIMSVGGVGGLSWIMKEIIVYLAVRVAAATGTRSFLDSSTWDPAWPWEDTVPQRTADLVAGPKRSSQLDTDPNTWCSASPSANDFPGIFKALRELVEVENLKKTMAVDDPGQLNGLFRWSYLRRQAVRARIMDYWCNLTEQTNAVDPCQAISTPTAVHHASVGMCLCLALHLVMAFGLEALLLAQSWVSTIQVWHIMLLRCVLKLEFESDKIDESHPSALDLLWVYGIGAYVEQLSVTHVLRKKSNAWILYTSEQVDIQWFSVRFGNLARRLGYRQYEDVAMLFSERYVHISSLQDPVLGKIFELGC